MEKYDFHTDSNSIDDLISQTTLPTNDANKVLKKNLK